MSEIKEISYKESYCYSISEKLYDSPQNGTAFYKGADTSNGRVVGIKVIRTKDRSIIESLKREINVILQLEARTRNIPVIYNYHVNNSGVIYIVMNFIDGITLEKAIASEKGSPHDKDITRKNLARLREIARILYDINSYHDTQHKDLKPANIMLRSKGNREEVYIIDFGISSLPAIRGTGTRGYQAPEQSDYFPGIFPSDKIDLFSYALIAYELLDGEAPMFLRDFILDNSTKEWKNIPMLQNPNVDQALKQVLQKCLTYNPNNRNVNWRNIEWKISDAIKRLSQNRKPGVKSPQTTSRS